MRNSLQATLFVVLALTACFAQRASAHEDHEGKVVKAGDGKLTMTVKDDKKEQVIVVTRDAKITLNGKVAKLEDLKAGLGVKVTIHNRAIIKIDARSTAVGGRPAADGVVVRYEKYDLIVTVDDKQHTIRIDNHVKVLDAKGHRLTGKQIEDALKKDSRVEITQNDGKVQEVKVK